MNDQSINNKEVRVRFAPSPTGYLHLGGARTALYNWLWARKNNGVFILRIEDTDAERSTTESVQEILDGLIWLGLNWDEGPYFQSQNFRKHADAASKLLESGHAYRCFCSKEELEAQRNDAEKRKVAFMYDGRCRQLKDQEIESKLKSGAPYVVRFKVPRDPETKVVFEDAVYGRVEKKATDIEDFVILRSDGSPLYILSNAVDDTLDRISHVLRGADGLANTPKQILIYEAMGVTPPVFAHMPLTLDNRKAKLSKRVHGEAVTIAYYRNRGFLPWALCNFMALLGWSGPEGQEFFTREELVDAFDLSRINRANSIFNFTPGDPRNWTDPKAIHFNSTYLRSIPIDELIPYVRLELESKGLWQESFDTDQKQWFEKTIDLIRTRFLTLEDFSTKGKAYYCDEFEFDEKAVKKNLKCDERLSVFLPSLADQIEKLDEYNAAALEEIFRSFAEKNEIKPGLIINAARTAVSGSSVGPGLFELLEIVGKPRVTERLRAAVRLVTN